MYPDHMTVPEIRAELHRMAGAEGQFIGSQLIRLANASFRKPAIRKARKKLPKLTPERAEEIRAFAHRYPTASQLEIANHFNTNPGRVSEALNRLR